MLEDVTQDMLIREKDWAFAKKFFDLQKDSKSWEVRDVVKQIRPDARYGLAELTRQARLQFTALFDRYDSLHTECGFYGFGVFAPGTAPYAEINFPWLHLRGPEADAAKERARETPSGYLSILAFDPEYLVNQFPKRSHLFALRPQDIFLGEEQTLAMAACDRETGTARSLWENAFHKTREALQKTFILRLWRKNDLRQLLMKAQQGYRRVVQQEARTRRDIYACTLNPELEVPSPEGIAFLFQTLQDDVAEVVKGV